MRPERQIWNTTSFLCHTKNSGQSQEVYKRMKCTQEKGEKEKKVFKGRE